MNPVSVFPAVVALLLALAASLFIFRRTSQPESPGRFASIDGLRGYLAFFVFLHHGAVWYFFLRTNQWQAPPSNLYTFFGQGSVEMFFMITAFLFWSKLIHGRERPIDWTRLFISRILRLAPLFFFAIALMFMIVGVVTHFSLVESPIKLVKEASRWSSFTILGAPDVNGYQGTWNIMATVFWSLPYEWFFYLSLPFFALLFLKLPPKRYIVLGVIALLAAFFYEHLLPIHLYAFIGGIAAAFLVRLEFIRSIASHKAAGLVAAACVAAAVFGFQTAFDVRPLFLLSVAFIIVACGNDLFGLLTLSLSRALGKISYSIYLLHGILLFVLFNFIIGVDRAASLSPVEHWSIIAIATPVLILICFATFHLIEAPAMGSVTGVTVWIRSRTGWLKGPLKAGRTPVPISSGSLAEESDPEA